MRSLIKHWNAHYYTEPMLILVLCIAFIISIKNRKKSKVLKFIPFYIMSLIIDFILSSIFFLTRESNSQSKLFLGISSYADYLFTLVEMTIFSHFYLQLIYNRIAKKIIIFLNIFFLIFFIYKLLEDKDFYHHISEDTQSIVYTVEGIILLLICIFYFFELFSRTPHLDLKNEPVFWVSTGLLFFLACTLPYSLLENYIDKNYPDYFLYSIFYIFYMLLFLMIIRAYLCKPEKTI